MQTNGKPKDLRQVLMVAIPVLIILFPVVYSVASSVFAQEREWTLVTLPEPRPGADRCVRGHDREWMRYHHMDLLKEIRIDAVRFGKRGEVSFDHCWECHSNRVEFCDRCHDAVNLHPDCFGCHYAPGAEEGH